MLMIDLYYFIGCGYCINREFLILDGLDKNEVGKLVILFFPVGSTNIGKKIIP